MIHNLVTTDNWNTSLFENSGLRALIGFELSPENPDHEFYSVSIIDAENTNLFQKTFKSLDAACRYVNLRFMGVWEYSNLAAPKSSGGCGSCVAH